MIRTPKQRFQEQPGQAQAWNDLVASSAFVQALDYALLQFVHESSPGQVYDAQAASHRLEGAKKMLVILQRLGIAPTPEEKVEEQALDYGNRPRESKDKLPSGVPAHLVPHQLLDPQLKHT